MPATQPGIRARHRAAVESEVLDAGRRHLARDGAAALSLRAIARDLGMASSAVYRYVANRDELLTMLIVAAFTSLGDAVEQAHSKAPDDDLDARWRAIAHATRAWAVAHPHEYSLVYGSPVPAYSAPPERTTGPGTRVQALLVTLLADATATGRLARDGFDTHVTENLGPQAQQAAGTMLEDPFFDGRGIDADTLMAGLAAWSLVMGSISAEVFDQLGETTVDDPDAYFHYMVALAGRLVLR